ncbi:MAG: hypothetical protein J2P59_07520 [Acidimicrobiales bacterium]|nr:hypothetical protein [Acidimicrobiales bacterium]
MEARAYPVANLGSFLAGRWEIDRRIVDRPGAHEGRYVGVGWFLPEDGGLRYEERGRLRTGSREVSAGRGLRLRLREDGQADVAFPDGSPFHGLDLRSGFWHVAHDCGCDRYLGSYVVRSPSAWETTWTVAGPGQEARMSSAYRRSAGAGPTRLSPR